MITVKTKGTKEVLKKFAKMQTKYPGAFNLALFQCGLEIFTESQAEVPVDTGRLRASGAVFPPQNFFDPKVIISYGTRYALPVHEILTARHGPEIGRGKGQKAKYLEDPFKRYMKYFRTRMLYFFRRNIKMNKWSYPMTPVKGDRGQQTSSKMERNRARSQSKRGKR